MKRKHKRAGFPGTNNNTLATHNEVNPKKNHLSTAALTNTTITAITGCS